MINALVTISTRTQRTQYTSRRKDGTQYTITATPDGYILGGVTFATLDAALTAATYDHEGRRTR